MDPQYTRDTSFSRWLADRAAEAQTLDALLPDPGAAPSSTARWAACETARIHHKVGSPLDPPLAQRVADLLHLSLWDVVDAFQSDS
ncbi:hypothetical protein [Kitasatospora sp. NBC_01302]|uniref:hypothetical protein n=1 Tax=Kitasatospora sp. NBC_01302 TaxID=2903575 RepID=UPI002E0F5549|nr:hypothetical protein OG294_39730 [Kitasatospora sp. NBC_01302]